MTGQWHRMLFAALSERDMLGTDLDDVLEGYDFAIVADPSLEFMSPPPLSGEARNRACIEIMGRAKSPSSNDNHPPSGREE